MKKNRWISMGLVLGMMTGLCGCANYPSYQSKEIKVVPEQGKKEETGELLQENTEDISVEFKDAYTDFAFSLFQGCATEENSIMVSPLSVSVAMMMTANGADGDTLVQMKEALCGSEDMEDYNRGLSAFSGSLNQYDNVSWNQANSIWLRDLEGLELKEDYLWKNQNWYDAQLYKVSFDTQTVKDINQWVDDNTNGMIDEIIKEVSPETILCLVNAVAFEAEWKDKYEKSDIYDRTFYMENGTEQTAMMMYHEENCYIEDENTTGFIKPYKEGYSFVALLPAEKMSLKEYEEILTAEKWSNLMESRMNTPVNTGIPCFKSEYSVTLNNRLVDMGMVDAFDEKNADFSKMLTLSDGNIWIDKVIHKTFIEVNEEGTKAGAATIVEMECGVAAIEEPIKEVYLNRPFVYAIVEDATQLPVFIGELEQVE